MINSKKCFENGLLKKTIPDINLAKKSIKQADFFLGEAQDLLEIEKQQIAAISLYNAYFHVSRALLFKDGIKERSHYCIARYLEETYFKRKELDIKFLDSFESLMSIRHNVQYSTEKTEIDEDIKELINICFEYINSVEKILK